MHFFRDYVHPRFTSVIGIIAGILEIFGAVIMLIGLGLFNSFVQKGISSSYASYYFGSSYKSTVASLYSSLKSGIIALTLGRSNIVAGAILALIVAILCIWRFIRINSDKGSLVTAIIGFVSLIALLMTRVDTTILTSLSSSSDSLTSILRMFSNYRLGIIVCLIIGIAMLVSNILQFKVTRKKFYLDFYAPEQSGYYTITNYDMTFLDDLARPEAIIIVGFSVSVFALILIFAIVSAVNGNYSRNEIASLFTLFTHLGTIGAMAILVLIGGIFTAVLAFNRTSKNKDDKVNGHNGRFGIGYCVLLFLIYLCVNSIIDSSLASYFSLYSSYDADNTVAITEFLAVVYIIYSIAGFIWFLLQFLTSKGIMKVDFFAKNSYRDRNDPNDNDQPYYCQPIGYQRPTQQAQTNYQQPNGQRPQNNNWQGNNGQQAQGNFQQPNGQRPQNNYWQANNGPQAQGNYQQPGNGPQYPQPQYSQRNDVQPYAQPSGGYRPQPQPHVNFFKTKNGLICIAIAAALVIACGGYFVYDRFIDVTKLDLTQGLKVTYDGDSGEGRVQDITPNITYDKTNRDIANFLNNVKYESNKSSSLKNGETIEITASYSKSDADMLKIKVTNATKKVKVSGLTYRFSKASKVSHKIAAQMKTDGLSELQDTYETGYDTQYTIAYDSTWLLKYSNSDAALVVAKVTERKKDYWTNKITTSVYYGYAYCSGVKSNYMTAYHDWDVDEGYYITDYSGNKVTSSKTLRSVLAKGFAIYNEDSSYSGRINI